MTKVPEFVYLIIAETEWPVSAVAEDSAGVATHVELEIQRRLQSANVPNRDYLRVYRARLTDVVEVEVLPAKVSDPQIRVKISGG